MPEVEGLVEGISLPIELFETIKTKIAPFASLDELRPALQGVHIVCKEGELLLEATSDHQMAWQRTANDVANVMPIF